MPAVVVGMIGMDCIGRVALLVICQMVGGVRLATILLLLLLMNQTLIAPMF